MLSIIVCLILGLNLVLGEESLLRRYERTDSKDAQKIWPGQPGGPWGGSGGPGKPGGWGKPSGPGWNGPYIPPPPKNDGGVLGLDKLIGNRFPVPASSPIAVVNVTFFDQSVCSKESVMSELSFQGVFPFPCTCNGVVTYVIPYFNNVTINGKQYNMTMPKLYKNMLWLNGNTMEVITAPLTGPPQCVAPNAHYWDVIFFAANNQYECSTTGLTGHTFIYSIKLITGPCQSVCWTVKGHDELNPPINNLGAVTDLANN